MIVNLRTVDGLTSSVFGNGGREVVAINSAHVLSITQELTERRRADSSYVDHYVHAVVTMIGGDKIRIPIGEITNINGGVDAPVWLRNLVAALNSS